MTCSQCPKPVALITIRGQTDGDPTSRGRVQQCVNAGVFFHFNVDINQDFPELDFFIWFEIIIRSLTWILDALISDPPLIRKEPSADLVIKGHEAILQCKADGNPPVHYEWFKVSFFRDQPPNWIESAMVQACYWVGGELFVMLNQFYSHQEQKMSEMVRVKVRLAEKTDTYVISGVTSEDEGRYFCRVSNTIGTKEVSVDVKMLGLYIYVIMLFYLLWCTFPEMYLSRDVHSARCTLPEMYTCVWRMMS